MRPQRNKLARSGMGAAAGNFLLNFAAAVFWLMRWIGRGVWGIMRRTFAKRDGREKGQGALDRRQERLSLARFAASFLGSGSAGRKGKGDGEAKDHVCVPVLRL